MDKVRVVLLFHRQSVAAILQGERKWIAVQNQTTVSTWTRTNDKRFSTLFFTTDCSADNVVKTDTAKIQEHGIGNGQEALNTLKGKVQ